MSSSDTLFIPYEFEFSSECVCGEGVLLCDESQEMVCKREILQSVR